MQRLVQTRLSKQPRVPVSVSSSVSTPSLLEFTAARKSRSTFRFPPVTFSRRQTKHDMTTTSFEIGVVALTCHRFTLMMKTSQNFRCCLACIDNLYINTTNNITS